ncbi:glycosyltransferase [Microaerobacter geothermalis]|uniref:glycosyltransferase family 2 protein n=1 Tax=Microaerobacter geothermalis TaxID=674972 RepID=UPI001F3A64A8|nr:glycosyltransferase [Microaerobacter geothermalis]MCF6093312.1 glycosyltransferase [Microaerobacter geothermalis]
MNVSIIIPTHHSPGYLELTLASFVIQKFPSGKIEILVIDDSPCQDVFSILIKQSPPLNIRYFWTGGNKGTCIARNLGIKEARGELIIFCDDDMIVPPHFIEGHVSLHQRFSESYPYIVTGSCFRRLIFSHLFPGLTPFQQKCLKELETAKELTTFEIIPSTLTPLLSQHDILENTPLFNQLIYDQKKVNKIWQEAFLKHGYRLDYRFGAPWILFLPGNLSVQRKHLLENGLFDENLTGYGARDMELGYRLYKNGAVFEFSPHLVSLHQEHPRDLKKMKSEDKANMKSIAEKYQAIEFYLFPYRFRWGLSFFGTVIYQFYAYLKTNPNSLFAAHFLEMAKLHFTKYISHLESHAPSIWTERNGLKDELSLLSKNDAFTALYLAYLQLKGG